MPLSGIVPIPADTEEEAREILMEAHGKMPNFHIVSFKQLTEEQVKELSIPPMMIFEDEEKKVIN